jgi:hypothetical protein
MVFYLNKRRLLYFPLEPGRRTFVLSNEGRQATVSEDGRFDQQIRRLFMRLYTGNGRAANELRGFSYFSGLR